MESCLNVQIFQVKELVSSCLLHDLPHYLSHASLAVSNLYKYLLITPDCVWHYQSSRVRWNAAILYTLSSAASTRDQGTFYGVKQARHRKINTACSHSYAKVLKKKSWAKCRSLPEAGNNGRGLFQGSWINIPKCSLLQGRSSHVP